MDIPVNRPSVIVFNSNQGNSASNYVDNDNDVTGNYDPLFDDDLVVGDQSLEDREDQQPDDYSFLDEEFVESRAAEPLPIADYTQVLPSTSRKSSLQSVLFESFDTVINPEIYHLESSQNFDETFREVFQSIFDTVVDRVTSEHPDLYKSVKVSLVGEGFDKVNLQFVDIHQLAADLFMIQLYNFLQSKREIVTTHSMKIGFTFTKYPAPQPRLQ
jgi:hypothetical protein